MSVDDRLRDAFEVTDDVWSAGSTDSLAAIHRRHRRGVLLRRGAAAGLAAAAVVTGAILLGGGPFDDGSAPDPVGPPTPSGVGETPTFGVTVLQGRWHTGRWDAAAVRRALASAGDEAFADPVLAQLPDAPFRLVWEVDRGTAQLRAVSGGEKTVLDETALVVTDDRVTVSPRFATGSTVHEFAIDGDRLRLVFVSTTEAASAGAPGAAWQRLLYDSVPFTRG